MIKFTKQELEALAAIEEKYKPELEAAMAELNKYDISKQPDEYLAAANRFNEINEKIQAEQEVYFRRAELRAFNSFNGDIDRDDVDRKVSALKNQILNFIYTSKIFAGNAPSPEERAKRQKRIEEERENLKNAIEHNEALLKQYPDDEELRKNMEELKNIDPEKVLQFHYDMIYSEKALRERIKESFALHFDFLEKVAPEEYSKLQAFIDEAIKHRDEIEPIKDIKPKDLSFIDLGQYMKLPQDNHTNHLAHKLTTKIKDRAQLDLTGKATIASQDFRLYIEGYDKLVNGANTSAVKFFDAAVMTCSKNRNPLARIPLKEYMELRGLKNEKEARKQIKADMEVLKSVKLEYKGTGKRRGDWLSLSLYGGRAGIYKGVIEFRFTPEFYASIPENQFMFIPKEYFSTRDRYNPHTAYFIRRIAEHKRMNLGKPNENIISVETLINSSPTFPKYEDVNYRFTQFMLEPFERDMDAIKSIKWHYAGDPPTNYNEFITSSVVITWVDYPDVAKLTRRKRSSKKGG